MIVLQKMIEYKEGKYIISIETTNGKSQVFVQDENHNLLLSCLSIEEAEGISEALLKVIKEEKSSIPF